MMADDLQASYDAISQKLFFDLPQIKTEVALVFGAGALTALVAAKAGESYREKNPKKIIVSGGVHADKAELITEFLPLIRSKNLPVPEKDETEGAYAARTLRDVFAVPASIIEIDETAMNTTENVVASLPLGLKNARSATVYCLAHTQFRALATVLHYRPDITATTTPVYPIPGVTASSWHEHSIARPQVMAEYEKIEDYISRGFFRDIDLEEVRKRAATLGERQKDLARGFSDFNL